MEAVVESLKGSFELFGENNASNDREMTRYYNSTFQQAHYRPLA